MSRIDDGLGTTISFSAAPSVSVLFWEKGITPPSLDGGELNDTTTLRNETYRTRWPKQLITVGECSARVAYDPALYETILELLNVNNEITIDWPDGSSYTFWGALRQFNPGEIVEGTQPEATILVGATNQNNDKEEVPPVHTEPES